jgi:hypothetical protein
VSTQQLALVDLAVRSKLLVDSVDAYVLAMPSPVNRRSRALHRVVRERSALVGQLQSILRDLGLERQTKQLDLAAQLALLHDHPRRATPPGRAERPPAAPDTPAAPSAPAEDDTAEPEPEVEP